MSDKIKAIIIEDDLDSQRYLKNILAANFPNIEILGYASSNKDAITLIVQHKPEIVFMDIELTDGLAFSIFDNIPNHEFEVIFITAHNHFLKEAIQHYGFSFISKPIDIPFLVQTVNRYVKLRERLYAYHKINKLTKFIIDKDASFLLQVGTEHLFIKTSTIVKCVADGNYTKFYFKNSTVKLASNNLKYYETLLINKGFFKAHRSVLINITYIQSIYRNESIVLNTNEKINISARNKTKLKELIKLLS